MIAYTYKYLEIVINNNVIGRSLLLTSESGSVTASPLNWQSPDFVHFVERIKDGTGQLVDMSGEPMDADALIASVPK